MVHNVNRFKGSNNNLRKGTLDDSTIYSHKDKLYISLIEINLQPFQIQIAPEFFHFEHSKFGKIKGALMSVK